MGRFALSTKNADKSFFHNVFLNLATNSYLGDPYGLDAYAYARVSSDTQAEEGRSGLPRQIEKIHLAARRENLRISWNSFYFDDESGFILERPALQSLIAELRNGAAARYLVIEHLDRLSRNADWHQGYLLDVITKECGVAVVFHDEIHSRIERVVKGAVSQDGMERSKAIMHEGIIIKAKNGHITANIPAFGLGRVDPDGKLSVRTRRETHYIPKWEGDPDSSNGCTQYGEAKIVREIFEKIAYEGFTLRQLCKYLNDRYGPPGRSKSWSPIYVSRIIQNPVYKGDFIANRYVIVSTREVTKNGDIITHKKNTERNPDEWIHIQVPPIVNPELWQMANEISSRNKVMAARNSKRTYLLTGLIKCEECTYAINAETMGGHKKPIVYYVCTTAKLGYPKDWRRNYATCTQRTRIRADVIETVVWGIVKDIIANPDILLQRLDEQFASQHNQEIRNQREYLLKKKEKLDIHDAKNRALVDNETYTPEEYKEMRAEYKEQVSAINQELKALEDEYVTEESIAEKKAHIIDLCNKARTRRLDDNAPMELKKLIIKQVVSRIILNIREQKLTIIGEIGRETYSIPEQMEAFVLQWVS